MARNASGTMSLSGQFAVPNTIPVSTTTNGYVNDILDEITDSLSRSGKGGMLTHLPMGGFKAVNMADGVSATDAATIKQVQNTVVAHATTVGGTADAITLAFTPSVTSYVSKARYRFTASGANTITNPVANVDGLGNKTIKKLNSAALAIGDIAGSGHVCDLVYDGTDLLLLNPATLSGVAVSSTSLNITTTLALSGDIAPASLSSDQNDYNPTGLSTASVIRQDASADVRWTGLQGGADGRFLLTANIASSAEVRFVMEDSGSSAANRFGANNAADIFLAPGHGLIKVYDSTRSRWIMCSPGRASSTRMEAATTEAHYVTPGQQHRHPSAAKFWAKVTYSAGTPTTQVSYNLTSITDTGVGDLLLTIATDFSGAHWTCLPGVETTDNTIDALADKPMVFIGTLAAGTAQLLIAVDDGIASSDGAASVHVAGFGDQ